ncbi:hypothetical protein GCM10022217_22670 [Chryseobacterium ginsenosidimutans]|uniref:hypothetical protein n=1 Tax=Chryseobacterium ginsenosidimutans TaxID=687846 RepID=UPI0031D96124
MDIRNKIKPATLEEAFDISNSTNILGKDSAELRNVYRKSIRDVFLDDAEVFFPCKMNDLNIPEQPELNQAQV